MSFKSPEARREYVRVWTQQDRAKHPEKYKAHSRKWYHEYKDRHRHRRNAQAQRNRWKRMGLIPDYPAPSVCELCGEPPGKKAMNLDHNHRTGNFRGWLCVRCNTALGLLRDSSDLCIAAARYLRLRELTS